MKTYKTVKTNERCMSDYDLNNYIKSGWNLEHFATMSKFNGTDWDFYYIFSNEV